MNRGKVYVGKKCPRGVSGERDPFIVDVLNINATSGSNNKINGVSAKQFSPMYIGPVDEKQIFGVGDQVSMTFENYYQNSKVFRELGHIDAYGNVTQSWYDFRSKGFAKTKGNRHPDGTKSNIIKYTDDKGKNYFNYYTPVFARYFNTNIDYITSRKYIYAPVYSWLVSRTQAFRELKNMVNNGRSVQILDFDVLPGSHEVTLEFLKQRINDPTVNFGHGNVLAGLLANIDHTQYCYI